MFPSGRVPFPQANIGVRTLRDPALMSKSIAAAVHAVDPEIGLAEPRTLEQVRSEQLAGDNFNTVLFASFGGVALLLAGVGIYGVMAFSVAQRSHEIAIRMALGSSRNRVVALVVREGMLLAALAWPSVCAALILSAAPCRDFCSACTRWIGSPTPRWPWFCC